MMKSTMTNEWWSVSLWYLISEFLTERYAKKQSNSEIFLEFIDSNYPEMSTEREKVVSVILFRLDKNFASHRHEISFYCKTLFEFRFHWILYQNLLFLLISK